MGWLGSVEWMLTTFVAVAADAAALIDLSILEAPWLGRESAGGWGRMGGSASGEWMPTTFVAVAADGAVNRLFSILEAPWDGRERAG